MPDSVPISATELLRFLLYMCVSNEHTRVNSLSQLLDKLTCGFTGMLK